MRGLVALLVLVGLLGGGIVLLMRDDGGQPAARVSVAEALAGDADARYARAIAPRIFNFPDDHGPHPEFRTEWWYYTGNVETAEGRHFGYQLTFFRAALAPDSPEGPGAGTPARPSAWASRHIYMAHFAVTDTVGQRFHPHSRLARGAAGLAGAEATPFRVWVEDWVAEGQAAGAFPMRLRASEGDVAIDLALESSRPPALQGEHGLSRKGPEPGNASYYYSLTRMPTSGQVRVGERRFEVRGLSWMDREWSTSALGDARGWDWFALQLDDGRDVMYYRLRQADGSTTRFSAGSVVTPDGRVRPLGVEDVTLEVLDSWTSPRGEVCYPARWRLTIPGERLRVEIAPRIADQEHAEPFPYWEGAVIVRPVTGVRGSPESGPPMGGVGYVELVGYAAPIAGRLPAPP